MTPLGDLAVFVTSVPAVAPIRVQGSWAIAYAATVQLRTMENFYVALSGQRIWGVKTQGAPRGA